ncbi:hypothetical protein GGR54DRAFT_629717 [Hypoxylon sp. NC1633]|nr:hypothetical protein GGR54DRAFT_629717 [Hypoxylon sp. NC1633]
MASFGKIQNSITSFSNENTAALVNINFDFSLFRCEPLTEFHDVGSALTLRRKEEAETGQIHRTACTLGLLFHEKLPDVSCLLKAYGLRASEILSRPDINPHGTAGDGPFKDYIGANGTSIWAAATSGEASISVHLLACMLARAFDAKAATSVWVEIVRERKSEIEELLRNNKILHPNTIVASKPEIPRADLAAWDVCARSWLRRADEFKAKEMRQFSLITENISIPYTTPGSTYRKVLMTWTQSMQVLNNLLNSLPQQANDRAILLAISSWHLFPNLLVFQNKATNVDLRDMLFPASGILSLGLEFKSHKPEESIRWSLALSHLRYYGDPVRVKSNEHVSRVTMPQLWLVALGSILQSWNVTHSEISQAIHWFDDLGDLLASSSADNFPELSWIVAISKAAKRYLALRGEEEVHGMSLVKYGWRRATQFFGKNLRCYPFFLLGDMGVIQALKKEDNVSQGFAFMRSIVAKSDLRRRRTFASFSNGGTVKLPGRTEKLQERKKYLESVGEICEIIHDIANMPHDGGSYMGYTLCWTKPPDAFSDEFRSPIKLRMIYTPESRTDGFALWILTEDGGVDTLDIDRLREPRATIETCRLRLKEASLANNVFGFLLNFSSTSTRTVPYVAALANSLMIGKTELYQAQWFPRVSQDPMDRDFLHRSGKEWYMHMERVNAFGCIAMFESGHLNIDMENLKDVIALCTENSIYVARVLLSDPTDVFDNGPRIHHLIGSIGQTGMVLLVSPSNPRIKSIGYDPMAVDHKPFTGERADMFRGVSMHLSFTDWKMPLDWKATGEIDQEIFLLESVVSVQHNGQWIADIDVLGLERYAPGIFYSDCGTDCTTAKSFDQKEVLCVDKWEELLDPPPTTAVLRANGNWSARLAATSILIQKKKTYAIELVANGDRFCWNCFVKKYSCPEPFLPEFIID